MENPLKQYFRVPGAFIKLPSNGKFYSVPPKLSSEGELAIYPMTAEDELWLKNPDALLNGEASKRIIQSCAPDIVNPEETVLADADVIMVSARFATYGEGLTVTSECPSCKENTEYSFKLPDILASVKQIPDDNSIQIGELQVFVKPTTVDLQAKIGLASLQYRMLLNKIAEEKQELLEDRQKEMIKSFSHNITTLQFEILRENIEKIVMPDGNHVSTKDHIKEWLRNIKKVEFDALNTKIEQLNESGTDIAYKAECQACGHKYDTNIAMDPVSFFA